jgi:hypothetical protein
MPAAPPPPKPAGTTGPVATGYPADGAADDGPVGAGPAGPATVSSFNYPTWQGELFSLSREILPFFSAVGGGGNGRMIDTKEFVFQIEQNEEPAVANNVKPEGWTPSDEPVRFAQQRYGVVEIHQHSLGVTYTGKAVTGQLGAGNSARTGPVAPHDAPGVPPSTDPLQAAINKKLGKIGRDYAQTLLYGSYSDPAAQAKGTLVGGFGATADPATLRKTQGLFSYMLKGAATAGAPAGVSTAGKTAFTKADWDAATVDAADPLRYVVIDRTGTDTWRKGVEDLMVAFFESDLEAPLSTPTFWMNGATAVQFSAEYSNNYGLAERSRTVGGVAITQLVTNFGTFGIAMDRHMPNNAVLLADMNYIRPVTLIPTFTEPLAKTGAYDRYQIYVEMGFEYGPRSYHGIILDAK